jgi:hypothetical protein
MQTILTKISINVGSIPVMLIVPPVTDVNDVVPVIEFSLVPVKTEQLV